jgi:hypothetical protein
VNDKVSDRKSNYIDAHSLTTAGSRRRGVCMNLSRCSRSQSLNLKIIDHHWPLPNSNLIPVQLQRESLHADKNSTYLVRRWWITPSISVVHVNIKCKGWASEPSHIMMFLYVASFLPCSGLFLQVLRCFPSGISIDLSTELFCTLLATSLTAPSKSLRLLPDSERIHVYLVTHPGAAVFFYKCHQQY